MSNKRCTKYYKKLSYYYIGHFSKYIKQNSRNIAYSSFTDKIEVSAFLTPDNNIVVILLNRNNEDLDFSEIWNEYITSSTEYTDEPSLNSRAAIVFDRETGTVLYEKNAYTKIAMASTTKIMTAILTIESGKLSDTVEVSKKAASIGGSVL